MDYDDAIDEIIFEYKLDFYYPKYEKRKKAEKYLNIWRKKCEKRMESPNRILCLSANKSAIFHVGFFTSYSGNFEYVYIPIDPVVDETKLENILLEQYQQVWIISLEGEIAIGEWLHDHNISFYSLYDEFSIHGIEFEDEFYNIFPQKFSGCKKFKDYLFSEEENVFLEWYYLYTKYEEADNRNLKILYLKKLFFLALIQRNFVFAEKYKEQILILEKENTYGEAWSKIIEVLNRLLKTIGERNQEDIIMLWMDQLLYGSEHDMQFVKQEMNAGIYFENAFTLFCNTYPTFRYLFTDVKKNSIDLFSRKNVLNGFQSKVCDLLKIFDYNFKIISSEFNHSNIEREYCGDDYVDPYISMAALLWKTLVCLSKSEKACFIVVHEIMQTHGPIMLSEMKRIMFQNNSSAVKVRRTQALIDMDEQLKFYLSGLNQNTIRIYMSDHGTGDSVCEQMRCMFAITGRYFKPQRVKEVFSYKDFYLLLQQMLKKDIHIESLTCEFAEIYGFPLYNKILIGGRIQRGECFATDFEFCGCVTKDNIYLLTRDNRELLLDRRNLPTIQYILPGKKDICDEKLLPYFRSKVGVLHMDWNLEKWKYAKYYNKVYENWKKYKRNQIEDLNIYISSSGCHRIGIRMGGIHSAILYEWLDEENQDRIIGFIDNDPNCECSKFGKIIVSTDNMGQIEQEMIILSSYENITFLRKESAYYPGNLKVFDMYQFLREKGYPDKAIYCDLKGMSNEGYDVNFPFEELQ